MLKLLENSQAYHEQCKMYQTFSRAEDIEGKIASFLRPITLGKTVLDIGCGNGKYALELAQNVITYVGVDSSYSQIQLAKASTQHLSNVLFKQCQAEELYLPSHSIDIIIATWSICSINGKKNKLLALAEAERVVKEKGDIYLVENAESGEFQSILGEQHKQKEKRYNKLLEDRGYIPITTISTNFQFSSIYEAKTIFNILWGEKVSARVTSDKIQHDITIFNK